MLRGDEAGKHGKGGDKYVKFLHILIHITVSGLYATSAFERCNQTSENQARGPNGKMAKKMEELADQAPSSWQRPTMGGSAI